MAARFCCIFLDNFAGLLVLENPASGSEISLGCQLSNLIERGWQPRVSQEERNDLLHDAVMCGSIRTLPALDELTLALVLVRLVEQTS
jgi:hypothetical protein